MALTEHGFVCTLNDIAMWTEDGYPILPTHCYTLDFCRCIGLREFWQKSQEEQSTIATFHEVVTDFEDEEA